MTRVLIHTSPYLGHLFPVIPIAQELASRRATVHVRTLASQVEAVAECGVAASALAPEIEAVKTDDWKERSVLRAQQRAMAAFARRAPHEVADLREAIDGERPDVLLVDAMAFGALAAAETSGLPWATWLPYPAWLRRPGVPPYGPGLRPRPGPLGALRDRVVARAVAAPGRRLVDAANAGRAAAGLGPLSSPDDVLLSPPAVLALTSPGFEHPGPWPASFHLVGPLTWEPPGQLPDAVLNDSRPIRLVVTSSDFQDDVALAHTAIEAFRERSDALLVVTVPDGSVDEVARAPLPEHVHVTRFLPHSALLPRALAVICHGGAGITTKALAAGVPVVAVPFGRDQPEVAQRLVSSGAGVRLSPRRLTPQRLGAAVARAEERRPVAQRLALEMRTCGGAAAAADVVLALANNHPGAPQRGSNNAAPSSPDD